MVKQRIGYFFYHTLLGLTGLILLPLILLRVLTGLPGAGIFFNKNNYLPSKPVLLILGATAEQLRVIAKLLPVLIGFFSGYQPVLIYTGRNAASLRQSLDPDLLFLALPCPVEFCAKKIGSQLKPRLLLMFEDCFYPELIRHCKAAGAKVALVGGRVGPRLSWVYRLAPAFLKGIFQQIDLLLMASVAEANRIGKLGAVLSTILVSRAIGCAGGLRPGEAGLEADDSLTEAVGAIGTLLGRGAFETKSI